MVNAKKSYSPLVALIITVLFIVSAVIVTPYIWMLFASFKTTNEIRQNPGAIVPIKWTLSGYITVITQSPFFYWLRNSAIITVSVTLIVLFTSTITGYVFAKYRFKGKNAMFWLILASMMVPSQITMIPNFLIINAIGLYNTLYALIVPSMVSAFGIFLCRQFCEDIPNSLCDAAIIDGAGDFRIFYQIIIPQLRPCIGALAIFTFLGVWNDYMGPLIMLAEVRNMTLPLALSFFSTQRSNDIGAVMAASSLIMIPVTIVFLCFQSQFIKGITMTGIK